MKTHVESFACSGTSYDLECKINSYCEAYSYNPISISVIREEGTYTAFVVVEESED